MEQSKRNYSKNRRNSIMKELQAVSGAGGKCMYCKIDLRKDGGKYEFHIDHIVPMSSGGTDEIGNLAVTCPMCNSAKGVRPLSEHMDWLHYICTNKNKIFP